MLQSAVWTASSLVCQRNLFKEHRYLIWKVIEALFLLWLIVPKYSGANLLHRYIDTGFQMLDESALSLLPPMFTFFFIRRIKEIYAPGSTTNAEVKPEEDKSEKVPQAS